MSLLNSLSTTTTNSSVKDTGAFLVINSETSLPHHKIKPNNTYKLARELLGSLIMTSGIFGISDLHWRDRANQSTIIEERKIVKISLAQARQLSINMLNNYKSRWSVYLREEAEKLFSNDEE